MQNQSSSSPLYLGLHHASLIVVDVTVSLGFYCDVLGFELDASRPEMKFPGAWINVGGSQQIHLLQLHNPDPTEGKPQHGGRDRHTALYVSDIERLESKLKWAEISYTRSHSGRAAIFCRDPDGNALEFIQI
jgi:glyoxylase I family protein